MTEFDRAMGSMVKQQVLNLLEENKKLKEQVASMEKDVEFLECLRAAGVTNWEGYEDAQGMMEDDDDADILVAVLEWWHI